ncbi:MAG: hypothetical protein ACYDG2_09350 [Ruminiclostridium sp.]
MSQRYRASQFILILRNAKPIMGFDADLYFRLVEKVTVFEDKKIDVGYSDCK